MLTYFTKLSINTIFSPKRSWSFSFNLKDKIVYHIGDEVDAWLLSFIDVGGLVRSVVQSWLLWSSNFTNGIPVHLCLQNGPTLHQRFESFLNYCSLFNLILSEQFVYLFLNHCNLPQYRQSALILHCG